MNLLEIEDGESIRLYYSVILPKKKHLIAAFQ